ncbi:MAG: fructose-1,6-bisphosphatase [Bacillota bacterium]|nr:fructose-1,6-bisphosphatase [Bacillota bacterium]
MSAYTREYLELLSEKYPCEADACMEIINLKSILALPKGTEHFISDLHGEYAAVRHILNNCSGVILEKVRSLFEKSIGEEKCRDLCTLIYYPREVLAAMHEKGNVSEDELFEIIRMLRMLTEMLSSKYTRGYVRKQMSPKWGNVLDELLHLQRDEYSNQHKYHETLMRSIVSTGAADGVIEALAELIKRLAVDKLHVVGDIFDRGPEPARLTDLLMEHPNIDIQWGNHDILWLGAASGSPACIFTVLRIAVTYDNMNLIGRRYGISLRPLMAFAEKYYGASDKDSLKLALHMLGFKLEGRIIKRHPGYGMDSRLMLERIDFAANTVRLDDGVYPLNTDKWTTIDPENPYELNDDELALIDEYVTAFRESQSLRRHMDFIYRKGSTYLCCNGNLLYHGCIPMTENGEFARVRHGGKWYSGKSLMDYSDIIVKSAWAKHDESALDMMWYLWCGNDSPFSGRVFHTFERAVVDDKSTWVEPKNHYFDFWENEKVVGKILCEFGLDPKEGHIINGHTPVKAKTGESPIKAEGRLFIIDGGFCEAYQKTTGIAGYTLVYNSHGLKIKAHKPFDGVAKAISENADIESDAVQVEQFNRRRFIADTDEGKKLLCRIDALEQLLQAYRTGEIEER